MAVMMRDTRAAAAQKEVSFRIWGGYDVRLTKVTPTLGGKDRSHKTTTNPRGGEFGRDDSTQRVVTANSDTHLQSGGSGKRRRK